MECRIVSEELGYVAEVSKPSAGGKVQFPLELVVKYKRKERNWGKSCSAETALDDLGNFEPIHMANDAKMRRFTVSTLCSGGTAKGTAGEMGQ